MARAGLGRAVGALVALLSALACKSESPESAPDVAASRGEPRGPVVEGEAAERIDVLSKIDACEVEHRGAFVDLGTEGAGARRRFTVDSPPEGVVVDREGSSFERVLKREVVLDVWLDEPIQRPSLSLRLHGGAARLIHVQIDDARLGMLRLPQDETRILSLAPTGPALGRGRHRVTLRFTGAPRGSKAPLVDLDWLRLSEHAEGEKPEAYAAPTREDVIENVVLDRVPKQSLVLRAPSSVRCFMRPGPDARVRLSVGLWGAGSGIAELAVLRDGEPRVVLATKKVTGGDRATWSPVSVDLKDYAGELIGLEFAARETNRGGRVAFGDPFLLRREEQRLTRPKARVAVVVVLASTDRRHIPPWGPVGALRTLGELSRSSVAFSAHRAPTTLPAGVMSTLLTGLPPRSHGLEDLNSKLSSELHTLSEIVKEASGRTAMFTGVPTTFAPFGFEQGWDVFEALSPVKDLGAGEPLQRAARFLDQELDDEHTAPTLVVVHARGGHPPWDVSREEASGLKPSEYAGVVDPRRGGIILGALRAHRTRGKRLLEEDWTRVRALTEASLVRQDAALAGLVQILKRKRVWDQTLFVVTSDVGPGEPPDYPYDPMGPLGEELLLLPLLVKFPEPSPTARESTYPSSVADLSRTILSALDLKMGEAIQGADLFAVSRGHQELTLRGEVATLPGKFSTRLGQRLLRGEIGAVPTLCAFDADPACAIDVFDKELIAARALWQTTFRAETRARKLTPGEALRRPVVLDDETSAALIVWGDRE